MAPTRARHADPTRPPFTQALQGLPPAAHPHEDQETPERLRATLDRWPHLVVLEGVLREHVRIGGTLEDLQVYGLLASDWMAVAEPHLAKGTQTAVPPRKSADSGFELVRRAVGEVLGSEFASPMDGGLLLAEDLGLDSLAMVEVLSILEEETGRPLDVHDPQRSIRSVVDLAALCSDTTPLDLDLSLALPRPAPGLMPADECQQVPSDREDARIQELRSPR